jgi:CubicO group peptidase (beta-lactamase class C family)
MLTPATRIRIGSTSKHFTVLGVLLLAEEGKLSIDEPIRRHLTDLPSWADAITIHQLVTHTSGMHDTLDLMDLTSNIMMRSEALPHAAQRALLRRLSSTNFAPGADWSYCNGGYVLLTELIETLSGMPYGDFLRERVFEPLGLHDTLARPFDMEFLAGSAAQHLGQPDGTFRRGLFGPEVCGEGGLVSSVDDLLRWLAALRNRRVGSDLTWQTMLRSGKVNDRDCHYAGGLITSRWRGVEVLFHTGHVVGGSSQMLTVPQLALDIVVLANTSTVSPAAIANQILGECIDGLDPEPAEGPSGDLRVGCYQSPSTGRFIELVEADGRIAIDFEPAKVPLRCEADGRAWVPANIMQGAWLKQSDEALEWHEFGGIERLEPLQPIADAGWGPILGRYRNNDIGADAAIFEDGTLSIRTEHGRSRFRLVRKSERVWVLVSLTVPEWSGTLEHDGERLLISTLRNRRIAFSRAA